MTRGGDSLVEKSVKIKEKKKDQILIHKSREPYLWSDQTKLPHNVSVFLPEAPQCPIKDTVKQKRDKEYTDRGKNRKTVQCLRIDRRIDPILYLPVTSRDRHRLIKWRMHWLPSYSLQDCRCGATAATREHYTTCSLLQHLLKNLLGAFGPIPNLVSPQQPNDHILNRLPRSEVGLTLGKWRSTWPALLYVLGEIDRLSHPADTYNYVEEPALEEALQAATSITSPFNI
ncbi:hypothetical protein INT45_008453 [Circinella minor]|uniref:Uncharacterized protein n=1 Tax=Circinella minor TaxID=1195481 RepID=A0A8H7SD59_9FUNG|nr:hypothetical protein INT45_008453 [Circinella minor]